MHFQLIPKYLVRIFEIIYEIGLANDSLITHDRLYLLLSTLALTYLPFSDRYLQDQFP